MIDGLKLTMTGAKIQQLLDERIESHGRCIERWTREAARTPADQTEDEPLLPTHICENEAERLEWEIGVLAFIREHLEPGETYHLGEADLKFGQLLPDKPGWLEQHDYEQENAVRFGLEQIEKAIRRGRGCDFDPDAFATVFYNQKPSEREADASGGVGD